MPDRPLSPEELSRLLINPFYAITIHEQLSLPHVPLVSKEQWIRANMTLIRQLGAKVYLKRLLEVLEGDFPTEV